MALLTDRTLAQSSAITPTTLIHIVTTGDTSQNPAGSSYKAELQQLATVLTGVTFTGGSSNCITDFYVTNVYGCSPITFQDSFQMIGSTSSGTLSVAEGFQTTASGNYSHSEGFKTTASGNYSHSEGNGTQSVSDYSHTSGLRTRSNGDYQVVVGQYNDYTKPRGNSAFIIGNGTSPGFESDLLVAVSSQVSIFGTLDVTGLTKTDNFRLTTSPNNGYVLVSDGLGNGTWQPLSAVTGTSLTSVTGITTSAFTATTSYEYYGVEFTGTTSIEIPNASGIDGFKFSIKDERGTAATYPITITPVTSTIDGNPSVTMSINYMSLTMVARNNNWWII